MTPVTEKCTLMCDDFRIEITNKLILIGLYPPTPMVPVVYTPAFPVTIPTLCFVQLFDSETAGQALFTARIANVETGRTVGGEINGKMLFQKGQVMNLARFVGLTFESAGSYSLSTRLESHDSPFLMNFDVKLFVPPKPPQS